MSIRANGSGDHLALTASFGITTGDFSLGIWVKVINTRASTSVDFVGLGTEEADPVSYVHFDTNADAAPLFQAFDNITGAGNHATTGAATAGSWFWIVIRRSGTNVLSLVFDDSASTTPLASDTQLGGGGSITTLDWVAIGQAFAGEWADVEFANLKLHAGISWSNAEARAESQHTASQLVTGTWKLLCPLTSTSVLTNFGTLGGSLTNTGCVTGASSPGQLTDDVGGGGGSAFVPDEDYLIFIPKRES